MSNDPDMQGEHLSVVERVIVSPAAGVFTPCAMTDRRIDEGTTLGFVEVSGEQIPIASPFRGTLMDVVAVAGERLAPHQRVAWLRAA